MHVLLLMSFILSSCQTAEDYEAKHDPNDISSARQTSKLWIELTDEEVSSENLVDSTSNNLSAEDLSALNRKIQKILNNLDQKAREIDHSILAPRPKAFVYENKDPNAHVKPIQIKIPISIDVIGSDIDSSSQEGELYLNGFNKVFTIPSNKNMSGKTISYTANETLDILHALSPEVAKCVSNEGASLSLDKTCLPNEKSRDIRFRKISSVVYNPLVNRVFLSKGIIDLLSEQELISAVAHELGHYYKAQGYVTHDELNYFYDKEDPQNEGKKPKPLAADHHLAQLGAKLKRAVDDFIPRVADMDNQIYHSQIYAAFEEYWSKEYCSSCASCNNIPNIDLGSFPYTPISVDKINQYKLYEGLVEKCSNEISTGFRSIVNTWLDSSSLEHITDELESPDSYSSFSEMLRSYSTVLPDLIDTHNQPIEELVREANQNLGHYTFEQEADEIGLELAHGVGVPIDAITGSLFKLLNLRTKKGILLQYPGELDYERCKKSYESGFKEEVSIADFQDPHHSLCYRIYHVVREARARGLL